MPFMAKKKPNKDEQPPATPPPGPKKRPPSRERIKYVALPIDLYQWLEQYAKDHSSTYDQKSVAWAARMAVFRFRQSLEGESPRPPTD